MNSKTPINRVQPVRRFNESIGTMKLQCFKHVMKKNKTYSIKRLCLIVFNAMAGVEDREQFISKA